MSSVMPRGHLARCSGDDGGPDRIALSAANVSSELRAVPRPSTEYLTMMPRHF